VQSRRHRSAFVEKEQLSLRGHGGRDRTRVSFKWRPGLPVRAAVDCLRGDSALTNARVRTRLRLVAIVNWLCAILAKVQWTRLSNANVQTSPEGGVLALLGIVVLATIVLGLVSGVALMSAAR
jgi:hypothetical protein